jgi:hypothetical protein
MAIALSLVVILYATSIFIFSKYRVEDLDGWLSRRRAQLRLGAQEA